MSTVIVITPLIIAGWPVITSAVGAAIGSMGFCFAKGCAQSQIKPTGKTREEIEVEDSEIMAEASSQSLVVEREGIRATFTRDARGALKLCMEGEGHSKAELRQIGEELIGRVTQQYVYHRLVTELKEHHMAIVDEQVSEDRTVKLRVRVQ
ncbi:MAG TPA: DUF1257 domain-containing protein [Tepidisphaeraceae bacterium]|nr:DUF1257 domain-containing protein [Tepidisphaeraceae bacterium]